MTELADGIRALTFDCYGTLIDWEGGIAAAVRASPSLAGCDRARILADRESLEHDLLAGPFLLYGDILKESLRRAAFAQGREVPEAELAAFAGSMGSWPPFPDSTDALRRLAGRYRLAILSNVETATLARSVALLDTPFDELVTAEAIESYKPARGHFHEARHRLDLGEDEILHVACSLYHDLRPAHDLGFRTVWINRRGDPRPPDLPDLPEYPDMASFATAMG